MSCKICEAPGDAATTVNKLLDQKVFLRDIAKQTGFSKSAVHRHSLNCYVKAAAERVRSQFFQPGDGVRVYYSDTELEPQVDERTWLIEVSYEKPRAVSPLPPPANATEPTGAPQDEIEPLEAVEQEIIACAPPQSQELPPDKPCEHEMQHVAGNIARCIHCGFQTEPFQPVGFPRDSIEQKYDPLSRFDDVLRRH